MNEEIGKQKRYYLFVGGPADGLRRVTDGSPMVAVADTDNPMALSRSFHYYRLEQFRENEYVGFVYFHESIQKGSCFARMIDGYQRINR